MVLDPPFRISLGQPQLWAVSVASGYCRGQYPCMHPLLRCRGGQLISACVCRDTTCDLTFAPSPDNSHHGHYSLVCVIVAGNGDF